MQTTDCFGGLAMTNKVPNVQECDATKASLITKAGPTITNRKLLFETKNRIFMLLKFTIVLMQQLPLLGWLL